MTPLDSDKGLLAVVSPKKAQQALDCGTTFLYELLDSKVLESFLVGRSRKITVRSINAYIERKLAENQPRNRAPNPRVKHTTRAVADVSTPTPARRRRRWS
jgi:hypothetical protein